MAGEWTLMEPQLPTRKNLGPKLMEALNKLGTWTLEIVKRSDAAKGFVLLPGDGLSTASSRGTGAAAVLPRTSRHPSKTSRHGC